MTEAARPLDGVRVLDVATFVAAPFCAAVMAEFGAEVIKVEQPGVGDSLRALGTPSEVGDTLWWLSDARNKKTVTLDLRKPQGAALFKRMVSEADVVTENFRPGTLEKWGLGYEDLRKINPGLVLLRVSAYGQTGPKRDLPGFARIAQAYCGLSYLTGRPDTPPLNPGSATIADYLTGLYGAVGVLLALRHKERTGEGQYVDVGLYETMFRFLDEIAPVYGKTGHVRERIGADTPNSVPHSHYPTRDGKWVAIACTNDRMFARLAQVMGRPELAAEERFGKKPARLAAREVLNTLVGEWSGALEQVEVVRRCMEGEVPCGPVNSIADIFNEEQYRVRENLVTIQDERVGELTVPGVVPKLSRTPGRIEHLGQAQGAFNETFYMERLGLSREEFDALRSEGVI